MIFKEFDEFYCSHFDWIKNHNKNNSLNYNSRFKTDWKLNMLWNEKINFVKETKDNKYFDTEWYGWCDIGYFRGGDNLKPNEIRNWPNIDKINTLNKNKIYYGRPGNSDTINILFKIIMNKNEMNMPSIPIPIEQTSIAGVF